MFTAGLLCLNISVVRIPVTQELSELLRRSHVDVIQQDSLAEGYIPLILSKSFSFYFEVANFRAVFLSQVAVNAK